MIVSCTGAGAPKAPLCKGSWQNRCFEPILTEGLLFVILSRPLRAALAAAHRFLSCNCHWQLFIQIAALSLRRAAPAGACRAQPPKAALSAELRLWLGANPQRYFHFSIRLLIWLVSLALSLLVMPRRDLTSRSRSSAAASSSS